jgi:hypothetical protein
MKPDFDKILLDLSYRIPTGIVDLTNRTHINELVIILEENGIYNPEAIRYLMEKATNDSGETFTATKKDTGETVAFKSKAAKDAAIKSGTHIEPSKSDKESEQPSAQKLSATDFKTSAEKNVEKHTQQNPPTNIPQSAEEPNSDSKKRIINGKDKTLNTQSPLKTQEYQKELEPTDDDFSIKNQKFANPTPPQPYKTPDSILNNSKFPKRYVKLLERFMNTQPIGNAKKISHYSDFPGGAGKLPAQAGELLTMMGVAMDDTQFNEFQSSISEHLKKLTSQNPKLKPDGNRIVNEKWLKAAANNRKAIFKKIDKEFPGYKIGATSWDTKNEVEALGMSSYDNKGYSTDIYLRLESDKGDAPILSEISLKQNLKVNLLNSGTGKFFEWIGKNDTPDDINPQKFAKAQRDKLSKFCNENADSIRNLVNTSDSFRTVIEEKGIDFDTALSDSMKGKGSRDKNKILFEAIKALKNSGDTDAKSAIDELDKDHATYVSNSIKAITTNSKLKEGILNEIKNEFPLKSVADNEESVVLGEYMLDKSTMASIFGTSDFNEFKEGLISQAGPPPFIAYKVKLGDRIIPIADIDIREDGRNYGGQFKFEMTVNDSFAKEIIKANKEIYG